MQTFTFKPDLQAEVRHAPNVQVIKFGGGFEQRVATGLNNKLKSYTLSFTVTPNEALQILDFFEEHGAVDAFLWNDHMGRLVRVVCREWTSKQIEFGAYQINCTFDQVIN